MPWLLASSHHRTQRVDSRVGGALAAKQIVCALHQQHDVGTILQQNTSEPLNAGERGAFTGVALVHHDGRLLTVPRHEVALQHEWIRFGRRNDQEHHGRRHHAGGQAVAERQETLANQPGRSLHVDDEPAGRALAA